MQLIHPLLAKSHATTAVSRHNVPLVRLKERLERDGKLSGSGEQEVRRLARSQEGTGSQEGT